MVLVALLMGTAIALLRWPVVGFAGLWFLAIFAPTTVTAFARCNYSKVAVSPAADRSLADSEQITPVEGNYNPCVRSCSV
jgi:hypothetical protein